MSFHPAPYGDISTYIPHPEVFVNDIYRYLLEKRPYFPGDTNITAHCIDALLEQLEGMGATREFEED